MVEVSRLRPSSACQSNRFASVGRAAETRPQFHSGIWPMRPRVNYACRVSGGHNVQPGFAADGHVPRRRAKDCWANGERDRTAPPDRATCGTFREASHLPRFLLRSCRSPQTYRMRFRIGHFIVTRSASWEPSDPKHKRGTSIPNGKQGTNNPKRERGTTSSPKRKRRGQPPDAPKRKRVDGSFSRSPLRPAYQNPPRAVENASDRTDPEAPLTSENEKWPFPCIVANG